MTSSGQAVASGQTNAARTSVGTSSAVNPAFSAVTDLYRQQEIVMQLVADPNDDARATALAKTLALGGLILGSVCNGTATGIVPAAAQTRYVGAQFSRHNLSRDETFRVTLPLLNEIPEDAVGVHSASDQENVRWVHETSGLTWEQLGKVFGVSRRAVHLWANGGRLNARNAETLSELVAIVRDLPGRNAQERRALLLAPDAEGVSPIDRMRARNVDGRGDVSGTPWTPTQLLGARHDRPSPGP